MMTYIHLTSVGHKLLMLFAGVMDVVTSEARSGLPSELLYADDLVIMAPTMEQLGRRVADWPAWQRIEGECRKVCSGGKMIVNSGKWPCGVCGKGVGLQENFCARYVKNGFTNGAVVCVVTCRG